MCIRDRDGWDTAIAAIGRRFGCAGWKAAGRARDGRRSGQDALIATIQPCELRMAGMPSSQPSGRSAWLRSRRASHPYHGWLQLQDPSHSALQARAILAAFQPVQPSSGRWLRWLCPGHPPGRMMAVIQPSQPFGRRMAVANSTQPSRRPDTSPGGSTLAPRATTPLFWMAGVVISQPSRWNAWSGSSKLSHPPADGCDTAV